jgi:glucose-6-phosphate-specific signal transduction histidine kinase
MLSVTSKEKDIMVKILDNGNGFSPSQQTEGFGLKLTKERIMLINQSLADQYIHLSIDGKAGATTVVFTFKNWL